MNKNEFLELLSKDLDCTKTKANIVLSSVFKGAWRETTFPQVARVNYFENLSGVSDEDVVAGHQRLATSSHRRRIPSPIWH